MARNMDNLMLEQSRTIRTDLSAVKTSVENLEIGQRSLEGMLFSGAGCRRVIDLRDGQIEQMLGTDT